MISKNLLFPEFHETPVIFLQFCSQPVILFKLGLWKHLSTINPINPKVSASCPCLRTREEEAEGGRKAPVGPGLLCNL